MKRILMNSLLFVLIYSLNLTAETIIPGGYVSGIWSYANGPYRITGDIEVPLGFTLVIEPGVVIRSDVDVDIIISGRLIASGKSDSLITFTESGLPIEQNLIKSNSNHKIIHTPKTQTVGWGGIEFHDSAFDDSKIIYVNIENALAGIYIDACFPIIKNVNLTGNSSGIYGYDNMSTGNQNAFSHVDFYNNDIGFYTYWTFNSTLDSCTFNNNTNGLYTNSHAGSDATININRSLFYGNDIGVQANGDRNHLNFTNCTITENTSSELKLIDSDATIENSIIMGSEFEDGIVIIGSASANATYSDISVYGGIYPGTGNINANPKFLDPNSGLFYLTIGSPCIDTGNPASPLDPDGTRADMGTYYFHQDLVVTVVIPDTIIQPHIWFDLPIEVITDVSGMGIISTEIELSWDPTVIDSASAVPGSIIPSGWLFNQNSAPASGQMSIWIAGTAEEQPLDDMSGTGSMAILNFKVVGQNGDSTLVHFDQMNFNEGIPLANTQDGLVRVFTVWDITGNITYCNNGDPVDDAVVEAIGTPYVNVTDNTGYYELLDLPPNNYVVRPRKENDLGSPSAISAFDAAWILQYGVGLRTFTPCQMIAGDVSGNGSVSAFDAAKILQFGVGLINQFPAMPDSIHFWRFVPDDFTLTMANWMNAPDSIAYTPLNSSIVDDYKAVLYGDVSGNWHPSDEDLAKSAVSVADLRFENIYGKPGDRVSLPLYLDSGADIIAMNFTLEYDPQVLQAVGTSLASLTKDYIIAHNVNEGRIKVALAGCHSIEGSGVVVNLEFEILETELPDARTQLTITEIQLNDGSILANTPAAQFEMGASVPEEYALHQNYPNPFNSITTIKYQLPKVTYVTLKIVNAVGQEIVTLVNQKQKTGFYSVIWDAKDMASGLYFYQLKAGEYIRVRKMLLLH